MTLNLVYEDEANSANDGPAPREEIVLPHKDKTLREKAWEAAKTTKTSEPITTEDISGKPDIETPTQEPAPVLVAPELKKFLEARKSPDVNPVVEQAQKIEQALQQIQQPTPEPLTFEEQVVSKLDALEQRELQRQQKEAEANAQAEYDRQMAVYREGIKTNIASREKDFPAIIALGRTEAVVDELIAAIDSGLDVSEEDLASEIEQGLWQIYSTLDKARKPSKETTTPSAKPDTSPSASQIKEPTQDDFNIHKYSNKKAAQEALWNRIKANGGQ